MHIEAIIFDCDGVLVDTKAANSVYYDTLLKKFAHPKMSVEELDYVNSHHVTQSIQYIFRNYPDEIDAVHQYRSTLSYATFVSHMIIAPDLREFLNGVSGKYRLAIITSRNRDTTEMILDYFKLTSYFDCVVTTSDVSNPKPHPDALIKIFNAFGLNADSAIFIGDSLIDYEHASSLGVKFISYKNNIQNADAHIDSFMELLMKGNYLSP